MRRAPLRTLISVGALFFAPVVAVGQDGEMPSPPLAGAPTEQARAIDRKQVEQGLDIYRAHCAGCHGVNGEGAPNWRHRSADGKFPAPPLDGSGHAWHHPMADLRATILEGSRPGEGNMPAWKDKLNDAQIDAVIAWFRSLWNDDIVEAWQQIDARARGGGL